VSFDRYLNRIQHTIAKPLASADHACCCRLMSLHRLAKTVNESSMYRTAPPNGRQRPCMNEFAPGRALAQSATASEDACKPGSAQALEAASPLWRRPSAAFRAQAKKFPASMDGHRGTGFRQRDIWLGAGSESSNIAGRPIFCSECPSGRRRAREQGRGFAVVARRSSARCEKTQRRHQPNR